MTRYIETEKVLEQIRALTPNYSSVLNYSIERDKTFTQKQWHYNMKLSTAKENLRKKSTRTSTKKEVILSDYEELDKLLNLETKKVYTKKWRRLSKQFKINRLMDYYNKPMNDIIKVYDKIREKDIEYDETEGKIKKISIDLFNS